MESQNFLILVGYKQCINPRVLRRFQMYDLCHWLCPVVLEPGIYKARMVDTSLTGLNDEFNLVISLVLDGEISWLGISWREFQAWKRDKFVKLVRWTHDEHLDKGVGDER